MKNWTGEQKARRLGVFMMWVGGNVFVFAMSDSERLVTALLSVNGIYLLIGGLLVFLYSLRS